MNPSRELDIHVAKALGWILTDPDGDVGFLPNTVIFRSTRRFVVPPYSTDMRAAAEAVKLLRKRGFEVVIRIPLIGRIHAQARRLAFLANGFSEISLAHAIALCIVETAKELP